MMSVPAPPATVRTAAVCAASAFLDPEAGALICRAARQGAAVVAGDGESG
ncbi:MAG: hypothetical protein HY660_03510 [Armatimonadetes bacterium]|nr:hypothetical protein [Armatimonadota bacterium]